MKGSVRTAISTFFVMLAFIAVAVGVYLLYMRVTGVELPFAGLFSHAVSHSGEVTEEEIGEQITAIGELSTASFEYTNTRTVSDTRQLFGVDIPGTKNRVTVTYEGVIKVSYDISEIGYSVDDGVITVFLPEPRITDNYIKFDSIDIESKNNILNPINIDNLADYFGSFQDEAIMRAEEMNIWEEAEERMMLLVETFLGVFPDYEVVFGEGE